jgi:NADPH:quinone reductase-like Zn-dependent oxidoreductase
VKAILQRRYGPPEILRLEDVETPTVDDDGVLVQVRAASVNAGDWHLTRGLPFLVRVVEGLRVPKQSSVGTDVAGVVEAVGKNVTQFRPGDAVFGARRGALAEYVCGRESSFVPKPPGLTFEQAAAVPVAGCTALQALRDRGRVRAGQRVLIYGAGGGVGTFAVQLAKAFGTHVTAVTSAGNVEMVRALGADEVIDYSQQDFSRTGQRYDLMLDVAGGRSLSACRRVLRANGVLVLIGAGGDGRRMTPIMARLLLAAAWSRLGSRKLVPFLAKVSHSDIVVLKELIDAGRVMPVIDRTYPLSQTAAAMRYLEQGHARGKIVITV